MNAPSLSPVVPVDVSRPQGPPAQSHATQNGSQQKVGTLAIAISEDFNDILTIIQSQTEEAARNVSAAPEIAACLEQILASTRHASVLARKLSSLSFPRDPEPPAVSVPPAVESAKLENKTSPLGILVVDDDENICMIMSQVLQAHGFKVLTATSTKEGWKTWYAQRASLSLLITDINMPGGANGVILGKTIKERDPSARVIYTSGHRAVEEFANLDAGVNYMPKPFGMHDLLKIVQLNLQGLSHRSV